MPTRITNHPENSATLNTLIATLIDSVEGYEKSAKEVDSPELAQKFAARAQERDAAAQHLRDAVAAQGGEAEDRGTLLGSIHRAFLSLREAVSSRDDGAIVAEIEHGEDYLKDKFETALDSDTLDPGPREAVKQAWASVKAGHDEMSALKHSMVRH
ncbi:MAG: PA2169 family four-helix-bundle protein [Novosphingobium sp.]